MYLMGNLLDPENFVSWMVTYSWNPLHMTYRASKGGRIIGNAKTPKMRN